MSNSGADVALAAALYGEPKPAASEAKPADPATPSAAASLYSTTPAVKAEVPPSADAQSQSPAAKLYGEPSVVAHDYEPAIGEAVDQFVATEKMAPADRAELLRESAVMFNELAMPPAEASKFMSMFASAMGGSPITDAQLTAWNAQLDAELPARYGQADYEVRTSKVNAYIQTVEGLPEALYVSGLGSHPDVVRSLMERAHTLKPRRQK